MKTAVRNARFGPRGFVFWDREWVREVADRHGFSDLEIPHGSIIMERGIKHSCAGRCFMYPGGSWAIGPSYPRHQVQGREGTENTLAHELLHAYLWEKYRVRGHDANFRAMALARGIERHCQRFEDLEREPARQLGLFDAGMTA